MNKLTTSRVQVINQYLLQNTVGIFRLRKIRQAVDGEKRLYAYAISLAKIHTASLEERVALFYAACQRILTGEEDLLTEDRCFKIVSPTYEIAYVIEAWRKSADKTAYIENGEVKIDQLHRMSCEQAAYIFKKKRIDPFANSNDLNASGECGNPADQYAALAKRSP